MFRADFLAFPLKPGNFKARKRIRVGARLPFGKADIACVLQLGLAGPKRSTM